MPHIRVYRAELGQMCAEACLSLLSEEERQRTARVSNKAARHEFVTGRALLRQLLSQHTGQPAGSLQIKEGPCGKPALRGFEGVHFNLSHSHGMAFVAIGPAEVGVDIERIDGTVDCDGIAETMFSAAEIAKLHSAPGSKRGEVFFSIWTRKEAYLKATGLGFSSNLPAISTATAQGVIEDHGGASDALAWHAYDLPSPPGFKAALVTTAGHCKIDVMDVSGTAHLDIQAAA